jgi:hypothetical protein
MLSDVTQVLAFSAGVTAVLVLGGSALVILVFLVISPWRTIRDEPPIPEEAETRLLLGEDFETVDTAMHRTSDHGTPAASSVGSAESSDGSADALDELSELDVGEGHE